MTFYIYIYIYMYIYIEMVCIRRMEGCGPLNRANAYFGCCNKLAIIQTNAYRNECNDKYYFKMSMNLKIRQQQTYIAYSSNSY